MKEEVRTASSGVSSIEGSKPMTAVRGRDWFHAFRPVLRLMVFLLHQFPRGFSGWLWNCVESVDGKVGAGLRYAVAARLAASLGESVHFGRRVTIRYWDRLRVGDHVSIHEGCYLDAYGELSIGSDVSIAHACSIMTYDHGWDDELLPIRENRLMGAPVQIANDVWIGCGVRILRGVTLGSRTIVAAGSVVTRSFSDGRVVVAGVPARIIRVLN